MARACPWMIRVVVSAALVLGTACDGGGDDHDHAHETEGHVHDGETEQITKVTLTFASEGGETVTASYDDPDGEGGEQPIIDPIVLAIDTEYTVTVTIENELDDPPTPITPEVEGEAEAHLLLFYGDAVRGPASDRADALLEHAYADVESDYGENAVGEDLPLGLENTITTGAAGQGVLQVMLRHLPEVNGTPVKEAGLPEQFAMDELLPGDVDFDVRFPVTVE